MMVDVEYLKRAPHGGNRYVGSEYSRQQMIAAGHEIERLRAQIEGQNEGQHRPTFHPSSVNEPQSAEAGPAASA
jgi:hypothetical protein